MPSLKQNLISRYNAKPALINVLFSIRRKKPFTRPGQIIGRVIKNQDELLESLSTIPGIKFDAVEFFELEYKEQIGLFRETDVMVGMHGAGLTNLIYTAMDGCLIELIPFTWQAPEYFELTTSTGRRYLRWRNSIRENHIEDDCSELSTKMTVEGPNICRTGASQTIVDVPVIRALVIDAVNGIRKKRGMPEL